jgi:hypothetical protein
VAIILLAPSFLVLFFHPAHTTTQRSLV